VNRIITKLRKQLRAGLAIAILLASGAALGQAGSAAPATPIPARTASAPAFDVATVKPSAPLDQAKLMADLQAGKEFKYGAHIDGLRAQYSYMTLKDLVANAYGVKPYQVSGPDWMNANGLDAPHFEIVANLPEGSTKDDAPKMLQALLADRFKLEAHRTDQEHPVYALVVAKGGPKMKESTEKPVAIDPDAPLAKGQMKINGPDGQMRVTQNSDGSSTTNAGLKGTWIQKFDPQAKSLHIEASIMTMSGMASDMLTPLMASTGRTVVDMTNLTGNYQVTLDISMAELMASARAQGANVGAAGGSAGGAEASDPGGSTILSSLEKLGLKLETRKAAIEQIVVAHAEKMPTAD
jgi:uncharacterized protein (TIGR03435 family)